MSSDRQTQVIRAQLVSKAVLSPDETELYTLTQLAGITVDQEVFKIILELLKLNVPPIKIMQTLKSMSSSRKHSTSDTEARPQDTSSMLLASGVPKRTPKVGDSGQDHMRGQDHMDLTTQSDRTGRAASRDTSGSLVLTSSSYGQDGSNYSVSSFGKSDRDRSNTSSQLHSSLGSDTFYGRNELRSNDISRHNQRSARNITLRQADNSSVDYDKYQVKEKIKKRMS